MLLLCEVAPKNGGWRGSHVTGPHKIRTKLSRETAAMLQPAKSEPSGRHMNPARKLNPRHSGSGTKCRKHGKRFFGLGNRKAVGQSWSGLKLRNVWGHAGHWAVIILILPRMSSLKLRPRPRWVFRNLKAVTKASNNPHTRMQSLSLANGNFEE